MGNVVAVILRYVYCCSCNVEVCVLLSTVQNDLYGGAGGSEIVRCI
jgi:hypothetical protein